MICAHHPQTLFKDRVNGRYVVNQEKALSLAAAMANLHHILGYYKTKLWPTIQSCSKQRHLKTILGKQHVQVLDVRPDATADTDIPSETDCKNSGSESSFKEKPHSNRKLYELLLMVHTVGLKPSPLQSQKSSLGRDIP